MPDLEQVIERLTQDLFRIESNAHCGKHETVVERADLKAAIEALRKTPTEAMREALTEAMRRHPNARDGLAWFAAASGLSAGAITPEVREWASEALATARQKDGA